MQYRIFARLETQWRTDQGFYTGFDYCAVSVLMDMHDVQDKISMLDDLRIMESASLAILNKRE